MTSFSWKLVIVLINHCIFPRWINDYLTDPFSSKALKFKKLLQWPLCAFKWLQAINDKKFVYLRSIIEKLKGVFVCFVIGSPVFSVIVIGLMCHGYVCPGFDVSWFKMSGVVNGTLQNHWRYQIAFFDIYKIKVGTFQLFRSFALLGIFGEMILHFGCPNYFRPHMHHCIIFIYIDKNKKDLVGCHFC